MSHIENGKFVPDSYERILYGDEYVNEQYGINTGKVATPQTTDSVISGRTIDGKFVASKTVLPTGSPQDVGLPISKVSTNTNTNGTQPQYAQGDVTVRNGQMYDSSNRPMGQYDYSKTSGVAYGGLALAGFGAVTSYLGGKEANKIAKDTLEENKLNNRSTYGATQTQVNNNIKSVNNLRAYLGDSSRLDTVKDYGTYA